MNDIPTAEELLNNYRFKAGEHIGNSDFDVMIEYAKKFAEIHVEAALKAAANNANLIDLYEKTIWNKVEGHVVNKSSILNAYPKENIR